MTTILLIAINVLIYLFIKQQNRIMGLLQDIQQKAATLLSKVTAQDTVIGSAVELLNGQTATLKDIKKQLDDALAANDPAALQAVSDTLDSTITTQETETQKLADAVVANTPAAPTT